MDKILQCLLRRQLCGKCNYKLKFSTFVSKTSNVLLRPDIHKDILLGKYNLASNAKAKFTSKLYSTDSYATTVEQQLINEFELNQKQADNLLKRFPELNDISAQEFKIKRDYLMHLGLKVGQIKQVLTNSPKIFLTHQLALEKRVNYLLVEIGYTRAALVHLFLSAPAVFNETTEEIYQKHYYVHVDMGQREGWFTEPDTLGLLQYNLQHLTERHLFLSRRGQYIAVDRHGNTKIINPTLKEMFCSNIDNFCNKVAKCEVTEFQLFRKMVEIELKIKEDFTKDSATVVDDDEQSLENDFANNLLKHL
uniref:transcription termination factor 4, mitochondrial-like n=1 Tax=Ciona intestinalis TaxID=7719 RepID=UPI000180C62A|nr:transcription termination factor 4, mitochondrial-like [Ciona intestinalis]|eukprot:XP_026695235.1 transcription termination factor 4, mitochondrial-like [Ciona intestinalis]